VDIIGISDVCRNQVTETPIKYIPLVTDSGVNDLVIVPWSSSGADWYASLEFQRLDSSRMDNSFLPLFYVHKTVGPGNF